MLKKALFQNFPVNPAVTAKPGMRNLPELIGHFPKNGKGMKVFKKTWPDNCYWLVYDVKMKSHQSGRMYGLHYWNGELQKHKIACIPGVHKRGIWQYDVNDAFEVPEPQNEEIEEKVEEEVVEEQQDQEGEPDASEETPKE